MYASVLEQYSPDVQQLACFSRYGNMPHCLSIPLCFDAETHVEAVLITALYDTRYMHHSCIFY